MTLLDLAAALALFVVAGAVLSALVGIGGYAVTRTVREWLRDGPRRKVWLTRKPLSCNVCMSWWTTAPAVLAATALTCLAAWSWWGLCAMLVLPAAAGCGMFLLRCCGGKTELLSENGFAAMADMPPPLNGEEVAHEGQKHEEAAGGGVPEPCQPPGGGG